MNSTKKIRKQLYGKQYQISYNQQPFSQKMQNLSANAPNGGRSAEVAIF